jgi:hypothetical protein
MKPTSFWQLVLNNPEWVGVFANALFAIITIGVITWQVLVMRWQGRNSDRHERTQNLLIRLQHEHEWVLQRNQERKQLLEMAKKLQLAVGSSQKEVSLWHEVQDAMHELYDRLNILDVATFSSPYDDWFPVLKDYVDAVLEVVVDEKSQTPSSSTRSALENIDKRFEPTAKIFLSLETAIRMDFFEFKQKWDAALPS